VAIHFDDCYRDVYTKASPVLVHNRFPACSFVSSGFVGTNRTFPHDEAKCPFQLANLCQQELVELTKRGVAIGAHTVNHLDLGQYTEDVAAFEVQQSRDELEAYLGKPVTLFSFPFGREHNVRVEVVELVRKAGDAAMFSAHGGYVTERRALFDIPRIGMSGMFRPLDLLMEIEGFSLGAMKRSWNSRTRNQ
jgi:peptidoglycan/xylan/chitin deacetylase (PgdA/CDA1 family)